MIERAISLYRNREANCALSIAQAWCENTGQKCNELGMFQNYGHGRAPDGMCGALYAATRVGGSECADNILARFSDASKGATRCREIRGSRALTCLQCVSLAARALNDCMCSRLERIRP
jgi:hypothetical protein